MKTRLMRTSLLTVTLLGLVSVAAGNAFGQLPDPSVQYQIVARHSGKCLDVARAAVGNGAQVVQWDCNQGDNQKWQFTPVGNGDYKIIAKHSGKSLDVFGGIVSQGNGVIVEQWDYNGAGNQLWRLIPVEDGYYRIVAKHSGKSLDINGGPGATSNGAQAQQWEYVRGDNQKFRLVSGACAADQAGSTFDGSADMIASRVSNDPFTQHVNLTIDFVQCRSTLRITNLVPITTRQYDTAIGPNITTVTRTASRNGVFSQSRNISIEVTLHFQHSLEANPRTASLARPSDLTLTLTGTVSPGGDVTLAGSGTFIGGYLNGSTGSLRVTGRLTPAP
jgi:hypothetical protein